VIIRIGLGVRHRGPPKSFDEHRMSHR
jgi:hypothetical protein